MVLCSALDDIPMLRTEVKQARGFVARGRYRKFMDYSVLKLNIPGHVNVKRLARRIIAYARRRAHMVSGHWRMFPTPQPCMHSLHQWSATDPEGHAACSVCHSKRTWIHPHQRGDAALGWVTHDYSVTHEESI
jgi:hypothetical protein